MSAAEIPFGRIFSMPAFEGLRVLRLYMEEHPKLSLQDLTRLVAKVEPDAYSLDLDAAASLATLIDTSLPNEGVPFYRGCISTVLLQHQPAWLRILTLGKSRFLPKLGRDEYSLFRQANLLDDEPDDIVVAWWDRVTGLVRLEGDKLKQERSRRAERLSLEQEKVRLRKLGITLRPIWKGFEDNTAGFDILSYDPATPIPTNRLIEVKSSIASPLRFILTRGEWDKAKDAGSAYHFHIWDMQQDTPILYVKTVADVAPHVPADSEKGKWKTAEIPVGI
jgi:hypothetical protein